MNTVIAIRREMIVARTENDISSNLNNFQIWTTGVPFNFELDRPYKLCRKSEASEVSFFFIATSELVKNMTTLKYFQYVKAHENAFIAIAVRNSM